jgi:hypothetical protein
VAAREVFPRDGHARSAGEELGEEAHRGCFSRKKGREARIPANSAGPWSRRAASCALSNPLVLSCSRRCLHVSCGAFRDQLPAGTKPKKRKWSGAALSRTRPLGLHLAWRSVGHARLIKPSGVPPLMYQHGETVIEPTTEMVPKPKVSDLILPKKSVSRRKRRKCAFTSVSCFPHGRLNSL